MNGDRPGIGRRGLLLGAGAALVANKLPSPPPVPIIDTHIHLFDPTRPQGAPYRGPKGFPSYEKGAFPGDYARLAAKYRVVGAIEVEASPWIEDNLWVLEVAATNPIMVGTIGNIPFDTPGFAAMLGRYAKNPLFRGIRYGNLWGYDLAGRYDEPASMEALRQLAALDLVLDTANPRLDLLQAVVRISDAVPALRIVIDHLPHYDPAPGERDAYRQVLRELGQRRDIFVKLSEVIHPVDGQTNPRLAAHRERLDLLRETFGEDRVMFASDWPNILQDASLDQAFAIMRDFYSDKALAEQEKFFWRNSVAAYKWLPRTPEQRRLSSRAPA